MGRSQFGLSTCGCSKEVEAQFASMETMSQSSSSLSVEQETSTIDEYSMQQSLLFSDTLKDLKNLRSQLYSAAEYFEVSYKNDEQKEIVASTLKDYAVKALVNTVDHLGSVSYKVNGILDEKVGEVSGAEFRVSCINQRLRTCQEYIDREGLSQQSLVMSAPKYHKRYILPVGAPMPESGKQAAAKYKESYLDVEDLKSQDIQAGVRSKIRDRPPSDRKLRSESPASRGRFSSPSRQVRSPSPAPGAGLFPTKDKRTSSPLPSSNFRSGKFSVADKRAVSPLPNSNPLARSGSLSNKSYALNSSSAKQLYPSNTRKSASMHLHADRNDEKEFDRTKSRNFLKALLTRRRTRKDEMLYTYLDEY